MPRSQLKIETPSGFDTSWSIPLGLGLRARKSHGSRNSLTVDTSPESGRSPWLASVAYLTKDRSGTFGCRTVQDEI